MADTAAPAQQTAAKSPAKKRGSAKPKKPASHPNYGEMIVHAIKALKERSGSSRQAISKFIRGNYKVGDNVTLFNAHLKLALKRGVKSGLLKQSKGTGATGSFRVGEEKKAAPKKVKKPKAAKKSPKKAKKPAKKPAAKKPAAKKTAAKKPAAKKPAAKKPAAKKPAAKKPAAKKPAKKPAAKKPAAKKAAAKK